VRFWTGSTITAITSAIILATYCLIPPNNKAIAPTPPSVTVSVPLLRDVDSRAQFLGQFSAVDLVELRPQVGGTLTRIGFKDGDIVEKGDLLFEIDPTPYQIKLSEATAQLKSAVAHLDLANREKLRATTLGRSGAGTIQSVDQRNAEYQAAEAAVDNARAVVRDAQFDLDHCRIVAPFKGRMGSHLASIGNLIAGSRAGAGPATLLATIVSTDRIYLNFDMSEADLRSFLRLHHKIQALASKVDVSLGDEGGFTHHGVLDFVDNSIDRSSGTIHARATIFNEDLLLTPGGFARVRLQTTLPSPTLLLPDAAILPDQSQHIVLTVGPNDTVVPKPVQLGDLRGGLRVIRSGLTATDRVLIDSIPTVAPGSKIIPHTGAIQFVSSRD
jgi:RND family efflux transporter MFP subunit